MAGELDHNNRDGIISEHTRSCYSLGHFISRLRSLEISAAAACLLGIGLCCLLLSVISLYSSSISPWFLPPPPPPPGSFSPATPPNPEDTKMQQQQQREISEDPELIKVLNRAKMTTTAVGEGRLPPSEMVILTTINRAWAEPGSLLDLFLESFWNGDGTKELLRHLVIVSLDHKAHQYCQAVHPHCYALTTPGDADIVWLRNPFPHLHEQVDFQAACDYYSGDDSDLRHIINTGFIFVRSNDRTRRFYKFWYDSKDRFPGVKEQDVLNSIKFEPFLNDIGLQIKLLDADHFGGICQPIKDLKVGCTMHAICCIGLESKIQALTVILQDWKRFSSAPAESRSNLSTSFAWKPHRTGCWGGG
ncbi:unnamed protein product [Linum tenue]|uniref:Nucleotide-diphospho-sugar transferase domain-containing protein n=1 Tax=Linum tenue TaxID=586396 RepID=A0AAV0PTE0_9ROSI|nr:unnamed protein product [Linum tenue]